MNHPTNDELLLLAYGELPGAQFTQIETHVAACVACQDALVELERGRAALDIALPQRRRRPILWATLVLAAAAVVAGVMVMSSGPGRDPGVHWKQTTTWSATAGYVTGGKAMLDIDAQLTRLEQERYYGLPN